MNDEGKKTLIEGLRRDLSPDERWRIKDRMETGINHLKQAITAFGDLGYETDVEDLQDYLSEAEEMKCVFDIAAEE